MKNFGINSNGWPHTFTIADNDDEEIAQVLQLLKYMTLNESSVLNIPHSIYRQRNVNENLSLFNDNIIFPAMRKLSRKLRYEIEDIKSLPEDTVDLKSTTIINIGHIDASNSAVALGSNIKQSFNTDKFKELENAINNIDDIQKRLSIVESIEKMKSNTNNKSEFKSAYNEFLSKLETHISIASPFLPYLVEFLKRQL